MPSCASHQTQANSSAKSSPMFGRHVTEAQRFARQMIEKRGEDEDGLGRRAGGISMRPPNIRCGGDKTKSAGSHSEGIRRRDISPPTTSGGPPLSPQPPTSPSATRKRVAEPQPELSQTCSPYGSIASRPHSARSQGVQSNGMTNPCCSSRPSSGATRSATSTAHSMMSSISSRASVVQWGPSSRVVMPSSLGSVSSSTVLSPSSSYQSRSLVKGQNKIYAVDFMNSGASRLRPQFQEAPRDYDGLDSIEKKLHSHYEVPQWILERVDLLIARQQQKTKEQEIYKDDLLLMLEGNQDSAAALNSSSFARIAPLHHCPAVACIVAIQLFVRCALERRRRCALTSLRTERRHRLPLLSNDSLDQTARQLQQMMLGCGSRSSDKCLAPHPPSTKQSDELLCCALESPSSPRRRQQLRTAQRGTLSHELVENTAEDAADHRQPSSHRRRSSVVVPPPAEIPVMEISTRSASHPQPPREISRASALSRSRRKSLQAVTVDDSIIKENAAFTLHRFFRYAAQRWKYLGAQRALGEYLDELQCEERVLLVQTFLRCQNTYSVMQFKFRMQKRSAAAAVIQRRFRAFRCRVAFLHRLKKMHEFHEQRIALDQVRDACRVLIRALQGIRAKSVIQQRQKLLQLKMRYREEAERRQRNQELLALLSSLLASIVQRVRRRTAIAACNDKRVANERQQEKKLRITEAVPVVHSYLLARKGELARRSREQAVVMFLQSQAREKHLVVHRVTTDAISRALSRRVELVTTSFLERCPSIWRFKMRQRARDVAERSRCLDEEEEASLVQSCLEVRV